MKTSAERFTPESIVVPERLRGRLDEDAVTRLQDSISKFGLMTPISVRWVDGDGGQDIALVAGRHRLEACRRLDMDFVDCLVLKGDDDDARLWEIAENLHRADLSVQERADHIAEWVRLTEQKNKSAACADIVKGRGQPKGGINDAVRELGIDRTEAQRAVKIAGISDEAKLAANDAGLNTQKDRLEIASAPADKQLDAVAHLKQRASDRKLLNSAADRVVTGDAISDAAQRIVDYMPAGEVQPLLLDLDAAKLNKLASAIRNILKTGVRMGTDTAVFDRTAAGGYR